MIHYGVLFKKSATNLQENVHVRCTLPVPWDCNGHAMGSRGQGSWVRVYSIAQSYRIWVRQISYFPSEQIYPAIQWALATPCALVMFSVCFFLCVYIKFLCVSFFFLLSLMRVYVLCVRQYFFFDENKLFCQLALKVAYKL